MTPQLCWLSFLTSAARIQAAVPASWLERCQAAELVSYLLDSNLVIPYLADDPLTVPVIERLAPHGLAISIITYLEVYQGTLRTPDPARAQSQFDRFLAVVPTLPLSPAVARRCAHLREELKSRNRRVRDRALDLVIAATALEHHLELVTRNLDDYADIPELILYGPV